MLLGLQIFYGRRCRSACLFVTNKKFMNESLYSFRVNLPEQKNEKRMFTPDPSGSRTNPEAISYFKERPEGSAAVFWLVPVSYSNLVRSGGASGAPRPPRMMLVRSCCANGASRPPRKMLPLAACVKPRPVRSGGAGPPRMMLVHAGGKVPCTAGFLFIKYMLFPLRGYFFITSEGKNTICLLFFMVILVYRAALAAR